MAEIPQIDDAEQLVRHVHPEMWNHQEGRPSSAAFNHSELSVDREGMRPAEVSCRLRVGWGFARVAVADAKGRGLAVKPDPLGIDVLPLDTEPSLEYNPGHALIAGGRKTMRHLVYDATVIYPPGGCPADGDAAPPGEGA